MQTRSILLALLLFVAGLTIGYYVGSHPDVSETFAPKAKQSGTWRARITVPGSVELPTENPIIRCTFAKTAEYKVGYIGVTHENLTDRSFVVKYAIFGYDEKGRRISEGVDQFPIGKHESVVRQVFLESQASAVSLKFGSVFAIQMFPE